MTSTTYRVTGMTCEHCGKAVTEEVLEVPGVSEVLVDVPAGRLVVTGEAVDVEAVRAAVDEAGYELA